MDVALNPWQQKWESRSEAIEMFPRVTTREASTSIQMAGIVDAFVTSHIGSLYTSSIVCRLHPREVTKKYPTILGEERLITEALSNIRIDRRGCLKVATGNTMTSFDRIGTAVSVCSRRIVTYAGAPPEEDGYCIEDRESLYIRYVDWNDKQRILTVLDQPCDQPLGDLFK